MFTGIITDIGTVLALHRQGDLRARIGTSYDVDGIDIGASIACDGVCLTVVDPQPAELVRGPDFWRDSVLHHAGGLGSGPPCQPGARAAGG